MKKIVEDNSDGGLADLLGEKVLLFCMNYFYAGKLVEVGANDVLLADAKIVFDTGELTSKTWATAEALPNDLYVRVAAIESYCVSGR